MTTDLQDTPAIDAGDSLTPTDQPESLSASPVEGDQPQDIATGSDGQPLRDASGRFVSRSTLEQGSAEQSPTGSAGDQPAAASPTTATDPATQPAPTYSGEGVSVMAGRDAYDIPNAVKDAHHVHIPLSVWPNVQKVLSQGIHHQTTWQQEQLKVRNENAQLRAQLEGNRSLEKADYEGRIQAFQTVISTLDPDSLIALAQDPARLQAYLDQQGTHARMAAEVEWLKKQNAPSPEQQQQITREELANAFYGTVEAMERHKDYQALFTGPHAQALRASLEQSAGDFVDSDGKGGYVFNTTSLAVAAKREHARLEAIAQYEKKLADEQAKASKLTSASASNAAKLGGSKAPPSVTGNGGSPGSAVTPQRAKPKTKEEWKRSIGIPV